MKNKTIFSLLIGTLIMASCVSKKEYEALKLNYDQCISNAGQKESKIASLQAQLDGVDGQIALLKEQNASLKQNLENCISTSGQSSANIQQLISQIKASNDYIKRLVDARHEQDSLNMALSNKLKKSLTDVESDDVNVKVLKGVVFISLADGMLYKSGSYQITDQAESVLSSVAKVINDYPDYDVLVEGNTDNVPWTGSGTIRDNWDLSALRATSVVRELQQKFGVNPKRMTAGGRGEYNPKGSNLSEAGKAENRRTEIIIMPKLDEFMKLMDQPPLD